MRKNFEKTYIVRKYIYSGGIKYSKHASDSTSRSDLKKVTYENFSNSSELTYEPTSWFKATTGTIFSKKNTFSQKTEVKPIPRQKIYFLPTSYIRIKEYKQKSLPIIWHLAPLISMDCSLYEINCRINNSSLNNS